MTANKHFVVFYTEPYYREIADRVAQKIGNAYARDIRHGGDPLARGGEILIGERKDLTYKFSFPMHQTQCRNMVVVPDFEAWFMGNADKFPYATRSEWADKMVDKIMKEIPTR